jgi:hypothetical protein
MKSRLTEPDSEKGKRGGTGKRPSRPGAETGPLSAREVALICCAKARSLGSLIFRILRETPRVIVLTTDPQRVREALGRTENEPGKRQTHD